MALLQSSVVQQRDDRLMSGVLHANDLMLIRVSQLGVLIKGKSLRILLSLPDSSKLVYNLCPHNFFKILLFPQSLRATFSVTLPQSCGLGFVLGGKGA